MFYQIDGNLINLSKIDSISDIFTEKKLGLPKSFIFTISGKDYIISNTDAYEVNKTRRDLLIAWKQEMVK